MKEYLLLFRAPQVEGYEPSPEELAAGMAQWQDWISGVAQQGKFVTTNQLGDSGKIVNPGNAIKEGPYTSVQDVVGGFMVVKTDSLDDATEIAKGCPIFNYGGNVEVRDILTFSEN